jgi:hypothetical protein
MLTSWVKNLSVRRVVVTSSLAVTISRGVLGTEDGQHLQCRNASLATPNLALRELFRRLWRLESPRLRRNGEIYGIQETTLHPS